MKISIVYNEKSGNGFTKQALEDMVLSAGVVVEDWIAITDSLYTQLAGPIKAGKTIAVVGGDGTQRTVAALLEGTDAVLAPLPGGTLNHFTKDLGVSQDMAEAIARLPKLTVSSIDVASVNGEIFVNNSSVGMYPHSLLEREKTEKILGKWPAAIKAGVRALMRFRRYAVTVNGQPMRSPFIFIGNNEYSFQKTMLAERTSLIGGRLTLYVLRSWSRLGMLRATLFDRFTSKKRNDEFIIDHPTEVIIEAKQALLAVSLDGEVKKLSTPLTYKIHPKSLRVLV